MATKDIIQAAAGVGGGGSPLYVEDVFSTYLYTGNGSTQTIGNGIALGDGATTPGWIATLGGASTDYGYSIAVDSSDNIYVVGRTISTGAGSNDLLIAKYNSSGVIQWQRLLGGSSSETGYNITIDSSDNIYVVGSAASTGAGSNDVLIAKYDSSGTIQWQRTLGGASTEIGRDITIDSSGNVYVFGYTGSAGAGSNDILIAKYNSSGTIQWQRTLGGTSAEYGYGITIDSSDNIYVVGQTNSTGAGSNDILIAKYNSSGAIQWQRTLGGTSNDYSYGITIDSSDNIYVVGYTKSTGAGGDDVLIAKYDSSGTIQWQRTLGGTSNEYGYNITIDSSDNIYVVGFTNSTGAGGDDVLIAKYDSSGTIQWQRTLGGTSYEYGLNITIDSSDNIYVVGYTNSTGAGGYDFLIAKLPADGSGVGVYGPFTYAASGLTDASSSLTSATSSLTDAASSLTDAASSLTDAASSLTSSLTDVPVIVSAGGLVWIKSRSSALYNVLTDTERGATKNLYSNTADAEATVTNRVTSFNSNGFTLGDQGHVNSSAGYTYASWTFRKTEKFFDVVTWTGDGTDFRTVNHSLETTPGMVIIKNTTTASDWFVWHRSLSSATKVLFLNQTRAEANYPYRFDPSPSSTSIGLGYYSAGATEFNAPSNTYVAYLFAHDAGGFGADGTENVISCGSYTGNGSATGPVVTLGYEPQYLLIKRATGGTSNWWLLDTMRGLPVGSNDEYLLADTSGAAGTTLNLAHPTATGFQITESSSTINNSGDTYIYIAIRRGPMKTPTSGTEVFYPQILANGNDIDGTTYSHSAGFAPDWMITKCKGGSATEGPSALTRLTGLNYLRPNLTNAEAAASAPNYWALPDNKNYYVGADNRLNGPSTYSYIYWLFRRAPGFFDVVCYTGTGSATTVNHNLGVAPEMMLIKNRGRADEWVVYTEPTTKDKILMLHSSNAATASNMFDNTSPTATDFTLKGDVWVNGSGYNYIAYLFATVAGVSKVGSYTGTATTQQIDCGFSSGARFVLIKRTDSTGDWFVFDTARGIVAGNDPYLLLNSTAAEVTSTDYVDTYSAGFEITSTAPAAINANGGSYIFLAIA